jgi:hypothetical protein
MRSSLSPMRAILAVAMACAWAIPAFGVSDSRPASPANVPDVVALSADPHLLLLKSGVFDPQLQRLDFSAIGASAIADTRYALVQFKPGTAARVRLQKLGVQIVGFIPNAAYQVRLDGVVVEISSDGGTTWNDLPPTGGYPNTFALTGSPPVNACGYAASHGAFSGKSTASSLTAANDDVNPLAFHAFASDLSTYAGQTVQIRFRLSSDPATAFEGFFLDQVQVNDADDIFGDGFEPSANICQ